MRKCGTKCGTDSMGKLTDRGCKTLGPGKHGDGDGLMLVVSDAGAKKWVLRIQVDGKRRDMGLGSYPEISLATARDAAYEARSHAAKGLDPLIVREQSRKASKGVPTFGQIAKIVIAEKKARTKNEKVAYQAERHLGPDYCKPLLDRPINEITTTDLAKLLKPVWKKKPGVARKLFPAIKAVFNHARVVLKADHNIILENPATWDDLKALGFEPAKELSRGHHPSLPHEQMSDFMIALRQRMGLSALMLEMLILTSVRTDAIIHADWKHIDLKKAVWTIPVENLKDSNTRKEPFRVPLCPRVIEILEDIARVSKKGWVFPTPAGEPMSNGAMLGLLNRMNSVDQKWNDPDGRRIVPHGFRATFKTWGKETRKDRDLVEEALGHVIGTTAERAYDRSDVLELRRDLMNAWGAYCEPRPDNVISFGRSAS